jgi:hypothetical protein
MTKANLALMPANAADRLHRRVVSLAAQLRPAGAQMSSTAIIDIAAEGFLAETGRAIPAGTLAWIQFPGAVPTACRATGTEGSHTRFEFVGVVPADMIAEVIAAGRKPVRKGHFGPQHG